LRGAWLLAIGRFLGVGGEITLFTQNTGIAKYISKEGKVTKYNKCANAIVTKISLQESQKVRNE